MNAEKKLGVRIREQLYPVPRLQVSTESECWQRNVWQGNGKKGFGASILVRTIPHEPKSASYFMANPQALRLIAAYRGFWWNLALSRWAGFPWVSS